MWFKNCDVLVFNGETPDLRLKREHVLSILSSALDAVNPLVMLKDKVQRQRISVNGQSFEYSQFNRIFVVGFGKAAVGMAQAVVDHIPSVKGVIITNNPSAKVPVGNLKVVVGGHPVPNQTSIEGTSQILRIVQGCSEQDLLLVLISGGGSSLLCQPRVPLSDLQATTSLLLKSGADIVAMNTVRKHLSSVKGGQLIAKTKATVVSLVISDIVGDPLEFIASGPTCADSTTYADAVQVLQKYDLWTKVPASVRILLRDGTQGRIPETLKPDNPVFHRVHNFIIANNNQALQAAQHAAEHIGYRCLIFPRPITGEARDAGKKMIEFAQQHSLKKERCVFLAGGETTVTVQGNGQGGRNQEIVLGCIEQLQKTDMVFASCATDGKDGNSPAAGAIADPYSIQRAVEKKLKSCSTYLEKNDSFRFFSLLDDTLLTGQTGTNVMDIQILIR